MCGCVLIRSRIGFSRAVGLLWLVAAFATGSTAYSDEPSDERGGQVHADLPRGKVTAHGLFRMRGSGWVQDDAASSTGKTIRGATLEFVEETDRVPLRIGTHFGYRYWVKVSPDQDQPRFKRVLIHPEFILPDGSRVARSERTITGRVTYGIVTGIDAYALSEAYELVEGEWVFQLFYDDELLTEQRFTSYWPDDHPPGEESP